MPLKFGGEDIPANTLYVAAEASDSKGGIDNSVIAPRAAEGKIIRYAASSEYQRQSFLPILCRNK